MKSTITAQIQAFQLWPVGSDSISQRTHRQLVSLTFKENQPNRKFEAASQRHG
jgi:hypothetical protein